jgi:hypothetical protein
MIWIFTCPAQGCENNLNPVYLEDAINPVLCGSCHTISDALEVEVTHG